MASLAPVKFRAKDGKEILLRSPVLGEGGKILKTMKRVISTSDHLLTQPEEFRFTEEQENELIRSYLDHPDKIIIAPEHQGEFVGMMDFRAGEKKRNSHVGDFGLSLLPEYRGIGLGSEILRIFLDWARANPRVEKVNLRVHALNTVAIASYLKAGFHEEGREIRGAKLGPDAYDDVLQMTCFVKDFSRLQS